MSLKKSEKECREVDVHRTRATLLTGSHREVRAVYAFSETLICATPTNHGSGCIPCQYKLFPFGHSVLPPNQRPEQCPRARSRPSSNNDDSFRGLYSKNVKVLTLGDGDFSFSAAIAYLSHPESVFSSHESYQSLLQVYPGVESTVDIFSNKIPRKILHDIDATQLNKSFPTNMQKHKGDFDVVVWNFPCVRVASGRDGQAEELAENKTLCSLFFKNIAEWLKPQGEVHVTHKLSEPFSWWGLEHLAYSHGLICIGSVVFDKHIYYPYVNRKVLDKKSFPCHDAETFVFRRITDYTHHLNVAVSVSDDESADIDQNGNSKRKHKHKQDWILDRLMRPPGTWKENFLVPLAVPNGVNAVKVKTTHMKCNSHSHDRAVYDDLLLRLKNGHKEKHILKNNIECSVNNRKHNRYSKTSSGNSGSCWKRKKTRR
jgi:25S rRNA (uracil2634-N3)-methyltransferase